MAQLGYFQKRRNLKKNHRKRVKYFTIYRAKTDRCVSVTSEIEYKTHIICINDKTRVNITISYF